MKNPVAPVIHSSRSRSQSEAVVYCAARLTWRTRLTMNMLTPYTRAIPARVPIRREGYHSGIALVYGVSMFMVNRMRQVNRAAQFTTASDWLLLVLLWITGATGFFIEVALYLPNAPAWGYWVFLFHVAVAMELMLLLPFTKFAHAMYRPVALFFYALAADKSKQIA